MKTAPPLKWPKTLLGAPDFVRVVRVPLPCVSNPDGWHSDRTTDEDAERMCAGCPVLAECYEYAMADPRLSGTWGGTTAVERRRRRAREAERRRRAAKGEAA